MCSMDCATHSPIHSDTPCVPLFVRLLFAQRAKAAIALQRAIKLLESQPARAAEAHKDPTQKDFKFWKTQPVPQYGEW